MSDLKTFRISGSWIKGMGESGFDMRMDIEKDTILKIEPENITKLEELLQLPFLPGTSSNSNVCLANSSEVRDDFKNVFTLTDLRAYCFAILHLPFNLKFDSNFSDQQFFDIFYPKNATVFWKMVALGNKLTSVVKSTNPNKDIEKKDILRAIASVDFTTHNSV